MTGGDFSIKRAYDVPAKSDGVRVLVDRLWPRGLTKQEAKIDLWAKDLAPSDELRKWFHVDPEKRFREFSKKYEKELAGKKEAAREIFADKKQHTLITAARDPGHSHVPVLADFLKRLR